MASDDQLCPRYWRAIDVLGKRWTCLIVCVLMKGPRRFAQIAAAIDGLSEKMLSERLKELEAEGIIRRQVYPDAPVRVEYALTPKGHDLERVVSAIQEWADRWEQVAASGNGQAGV